MPSTWLRLSNAAARVICTGFRGMSSYKFMKPNPLDKRTRFLFCGNCGPGVGHSEQLIHDVFRPFGVQEIVIPDAQSTFIFAIFNDEDGAAKAYGELKDAPCPGLGNRKLILRFSDAVQVKEPAAPSHARPVARTAAELGVPGLCLVLDFVTESQEAELLAAVDQHPWVDLAKRRVQHYGWEFDYVTRSFSRPLGGLPTWAADVVQRAGAHPSVAMQLDQLTVNEYTPGVGLSPHVDTHSAFTGAIVSLSLASDVVMELRQGDDHRPLLLPRRSLLIFAGEARYAWQHYIPHRKSDWLGPPTGSTDSSAGSTASAGSEPRGAQLLHRGRRVSLTLRRVRGAPCDCAWPEYCDTRAGGAPPTRLALLQQQPPQEDGQQGQTQQDGSVSSRAGTRDTQSPFESASASTPNNIGSATLHKSVASPASGAPGPGSVFQMDGAGTGPGGTAAATGSTGGAGAAAALHTTGEEADLVALEKRHVVAVYDAIAPHFSATRFAIWPAVKAFMGQLPPGAVVADVGCGNGKYFGVRKDVAVMGSDRSWGLAEVAARRVAAAGAGPGPERVPTADVLQADALALPYRDASCDGVLCIAVLHHISSVARRVRLLAELTRLLRPGGRAIVTVWAVEQEDPIKTLDKWTRIAAPEAGAAAAETGRGAAADTGPAAGAAAAAAVSGAGFDAAEDVSGSDAAPHSMGQQEELEEDPRAHHPLHGRQAAQQVQGGGSSGQEPFQVQAGDQQQVSSSAGLALKGADYMVPWHLPFHRAGVAAAVQLAGNAKAGATAASSTVVAGAGAQGSSGEGIPLAGSSTDQHGPQRPGSPQTGWSNKEALPQSGAGAPSNNPTPAAVNEAKGAVVFQRYYHLFEKGELDGLVGQVPQVNVVDSFYDRSNWCVVFERMQ